MLPSTLTLFLCYLKIRNMFLFCLNQRAPNPILDLCFPTENCSYFVLSMSKKWKAMQLEEKLHFLFANRLGLK